MELCLPHPPVRTQQIFAPFVHMYHYNTTLPNNATRIIMLITYIAEISTKLGKNLKRIRTAKKLSQGAIFRKLEVHRAYISGIENGKRNPTLATIQKLAEALGISADELLK
jgi:predicted transcriptional regulator